MTDWHRPFWQQDVGPVYTEIRGDRGYFAMLAVDPAHQGTGLARY